MVFFEKKRYYISMSSNCHYNLSQFLKKINHRVPLEENISMTKYTTFACGGNADYLITPRNRKELQWLLKQAYRYQQRLFFLGLGANCLVSDLGIREPVIHSTSLKHIHYRQAKGKQEAQLTVECGVTIEELGQFCLEKGLSGLENFAGLPGSIGGALFMNARCYEENFSEKVLSIRYLTPKGKIKRLKKKFIQDPQHFGYKSSPFQKGNDFIYDATLSVRAEDPKKIQEKMEQRIQDRIQKGHFLNPSAGSTFKNNRKWGKPTGSIIDELGLKGYQIGDAQVAPYHGNIIINKGNSCASDIYRLIKKVKQEVYEKTGFPIEEEVLFIGEWKDER